MEVNVHYSDYIDVDVDFDDLDIDEILCEIGERYNTRNPVVRNYINNLTESAADFDFNFTYYPNKNYAKNYFEQNCPNFKNIIKFIKENY